MLVIIPPTTTMDMSRIETEFVATKPEFQKQAEYVIENFSQYSIEGLMRLFDISEKLAKKAYDEYQDFFSSEYAKPAIYAYTGSVYKSLNPHSFQIDDFNFAQSIVRIVSSVYGLLRPLDAIKAYRSTFFLKKKDLPEQDLVSFWHDKINDSLKSDAFRDNRQILFLCVHDMLKIIDQEELEKDNRFVVVTFKDMKDGEWKVIREFEKPAIGNMLSWIIKNKIEHIDDITKWNEDGYKFNLSLSKRDEFVFTREHK